MVFLLNIYQRDAHQQVSHLFGAFPEVLEPAGPVG